MKQQSLLRRLLLLVMLLALLLAAVAPAFAQEGEGEAAAEGEAPAAEVAAEEGGESPLDALGINMGFLLAQIINFGLIFALLLFGLWRPAVNRLDARAEKIRKGMEDAAIAANARRDAEADAEKLKAAAQADINRMVEEARSRGEQIAKEIETAARADADKIRSDARISAEVERNAQLADLRGQVAAISVAVAQRLIGESMDQKRQEALINDFFAKVPAEARSMSGAITVISAMPLTDGEQATVKREVGSSEITFTVDPNILGGLIIRAGDRVVDGSVRSGLSGLAARLS